MPKIDFSSLKHQHNIAVGLSGGGDSMALTHMLSRWAVQNDVHIHALSVDHNLRKNSAAEAVTVGGYIKKFEHVTHHILKWDAGEGAKTALMEQARNARYALMIEYCKSNDIQTLAIGHHGDDQIETFLFRLSKGSGVDGLAAMPETTMRDGVVIYRPLLAQSHHDLIQYCKSHQLKWIEDPSNKDSQFARPRLRKALEEEGLTTKRMAKTVQRMGDARDAIQWLVDKAIDEVLTQLPASSSFLRRQESSAVLEMDSCLRRNDTDCENIDIACIDWQTLTQYPRAVTVRVLQSVLATNGKDAGGYSPKLERVESIVATIRPSKSATLHGCLITLSKDGKTLEIKAA